jgi:membrane associated rhomboid family serine protease
MVFEAKNDRIPFHLQYVSLGILIINIIAFIVQLTDPTGYMYIYEAAFIPAEFFRGQKVWTIISAMFMHADPVHIVGNMMFFIVISDNVEHTMGHIVYFLTYIVCGLSASILHALFSLLSPGMASIPSLGASGAIFGIIAIYGILFPNNQLYMMGKVSVRIKAKMFILVYFIQQVLYALIFWNIGSGVAYFAHIGGFVMGALIAIIFKKINRY